MGFRLLYLPPWPLSLGCTERHACRHLSRIPPGRDLVRMESANRDISTETQALHTNAWGVGR